MSKPKLADIYCGAGGAGVGYARAGFKVVGIDIEPQKNYPFDFIQADARTLTKDFFSDFDALHGSPPCQRYTWCTPPQFRENHPDLIDTTRKQFKATGLPFVIENVPGARRELINPIMLCGTMFGLDIWRHRYFELGGFDIPLVPPCKHEGHPVLITGTHRRKTGRFEYGVEECRQASGIPWMTRTEIDQAIPPAYTEYIGKFLLKHLGMK